LLGIKIASADFCSENSKKEEKEEMKEAFSEKGGQGGVFTSRIMMVDKNQSSIDCATIRKCSDKTVCSICKKIIRENPFIVQYYEASNLLVSHICIF